VGEKHTGLLGKKGKVHERTMGRGGGRKNLWYPKTGGFRTGFVIEKRVPKRGGGDFFK